MPVRNVGRVEWLREVSANLGGGWCRWCIAQGWADEAAAYASKAAWVAHLAEKLERRQTMALVKSTRL